MKICSILNAHVCVHVVMYTVLSVIVDILSKDKSQYSLIQTQTNTYMKKNRSFRLYIILQSMYDTSKYLIKFYNLGAGGCRGILFFVLNAGYQMTTFYIK